MNKNPIIFLISKPVKPAQNIFKTSVKSSDANVMVKIPFDGDRGKKAKSEPTIVSPNNPPMPKLWIHLSIGTMEAAYTDDKPIAIGTNINRPTARSDPMCNRRRSPQINKIGTKDQEPQPITSIKGEAIAAPVLPSIFCTGVSDADSGPGSVGE